MNKVAKFLIAGTIFILIWTTLFLKFVLPYFAGFFFGFGIDLPFSSRWVAEHSVLASIIVWSLLALPFAVAFCSLMLVLRRLRKSRQNAS
ncbi:MAG: hypothetical protein HYX26_07690 [Acidobacteriales bacterium]|nr:hypothetical protein [Terriglobales bacterium]